MPSGLLDILTPPQWIGLTAMLGFLTFIYKIGAAVRKSINRQIKTWENLVEGFPAFGKELEKIRILLEAGQGRMGRGEVKADEHALRITSMEERVGRVEGHVQALTSEQKKTRTEVHDILVREAAAKLAKGQ